VANRNVKYANRNAKCAYRGGYCAYRVAKYAIRMAKKGNHGGIAPTFAFNGVTWQKILYFNA